MYKDEQRADCLTMWKYLNHLYHTSQWTFIHTFKSMLQ